MQAGRGRLAAGPEAGERTAPGPVGGDAAHVVMRRCRYRNRIAHRIETRPGAGRGHHRKPRGEGGADRGAGVEHGPPPGHGLGMDGPRHDIARGEFGIGMERQQEADPPGVDERRPRPPQRLGGERGGILGQVDRGRVELHEFGIGDHRPGPRRHAERLPADARRIDGDGIEPRRPASGHQHRRRPQQERGRGRVRPRQTDPRHAALRDLEPRRHHALGHLDRGRLAHGGNDRRHDLAPGPVALHAHHPRPAVGGLQRQDIAACRIAIEGRAEAAEIEDMIAGARRDHRRHLGIDDARAGAHRVGGMVLGAVPRADRGGDATLRPGRGGPCPEFLGRDHEHRARRQPQRRAERRKAGPDDDHPAGHGHLPGRRAHAATARRDSSIIRSTARRAGAAMPAATSTGVVMLCSDQSTFSSVIIFM